MKLHLATIALASLAAASCETVLPPRPAELDLWADAAAGVDDPDLAGLCEAYWKSYLKADPFEATFLGDPRYHGKVPRVDLRFRAEREKALGELARLVRTVDPGDLSARDRLTHRMLAQEIERERAELAIGLDRWNVDPVEGPLIQLLNLPQVQPTGTARERAQLVERWESVPHWIRDVSANLRRELGQGRVASYTAVSKAIAQVEEFLDTVATESPLVDIAAGGGRWIDFPPGSNVAEVAHRELGDARAQRELRLLNLHLQDGERLAIGTRLLLPNPDDPLTAEERGRFLHGVLMAVEEGIYPAFSRYRDLLEGEILTVARDDERPGLVHVPGGEAAYKKLVWLHTSLPEEQCDPQAIHDYGLAEVARIRSEISGLGRKLFGTDDVAAIQRRLRHDPAMHFDTEEEVRAKALDCLRRASERMADYFGILPRADCDVVEIPPHEAPDSTIAYYRKPWPDGSRPGRYYVNTYLPQTRPRYEAEVLAYHEAIPGHHLQIAIAQELDDVPLFRRHLGWTAFVEGWALYTERLSDEMGLYTADLDRMGVASFDAWRASRLVVDTGIHAFGWSRDQAIDYLIENTLLAPNNCENEVDRYIAWPGQALAYKIGQREILALRERAREVLGSRFSYPQFHDRVLENGALSLEALTGVVDDWLEDEGGRPVAGP